MTGSDDAVGHNDTAQLIERRLREAFQPTRLEIRDDSHKHVGHPGATSGGGHFDVLIESAAFEGLSLLEQHRRVNDTLRDLFGPSIHALKLKTVCPEPGSGGG